MKLPSTPVKAKYSICNGGGCSRWAGSERLEIRRRLVRSACRGLLHNADGGARRIRRDPGTPERAFTGCGEEPFLCAGLSTWGAFGLACHGRRIQVARLLWISLGTDDVRSRGYRPDDCDILVWPGGKGSQLPAQHGNIMKQGLNAVWSGSTPRRIP